MKLSIVKPDIICGKMFRGETIIADGKKKYINCYFEQLVIDGWRHDCFDGCWFESCVVPFLECTSFKENNTIFACRNAAREGRDPFPPVVYN